MQHRTTEFDAASAEAFASKISAMLDGGAVAVMLSIGHRTGLLDTLTTLPPSTSAQIADAANLSERYVREWLAVMVTGGVVVYDPKHRTYTLPADHAACLTRGGQLGNQAVYAQHIALLGAVQDRIVDCFKSGSGTIYEDYPNFHRIMAEDSGQTVTAGLFEAILPLIEGIDQRLEQGIDVLDAGCGAGSALIALAQRYPDSRFVGYDLDADAIQMGADTVRRMKLKNIVLEQRDLTDFDERARFDFVTTFDAVHDQKDPQGLIVRLFGALRHGGVYLMQDIGGSAKLENNLDFPAAAMLYAISCAICTPISLGQGGKGLGTMWGWETAERMLREAGFQSVARHVLAHDPMNVWFVSAKD